MFKCLTPLALRKSGSTGILILPLWSLAKFGPLPFENQIESVIIIMYVMYLTSAAREIFKDCSLAQKFGSLTQRLCCYI